MQSVKLENPLRLVAFYLPQYHPIPENDQWWGRGFTEWTNVARALPLYNGHYQPHLPADLGYYDLRVPEVRQAQAELASSYGVYGFCYYHYWFHGKRLLERPFAEVLGAGQPDFPFCLCWANESWSRRWLGDGRNILIRQAYSPQDDLTHVRSLLSTFADPRHIKVSGRPLFLVYRPTDLPNPHHTTDLFREQCVTNGLPEPYLVGVNAHCATEDCRRLGFDHTLDFRPQLAALPGAFAEGCSWQTLHRNLRQGIVSANLKVYDYDEAVTLMERMPRCGTTIPSVFVGWDNVARRGDRGIIIKGASPDKFARQLTQAIDRAAVVGDVANLIFVNAWNEWAEGNHLEPDQKFGHGFLDVLRRAVSTDQGLRA
jgi:lipopolysaccharide biosynthesis protein